MVEIPDIKEKDSLKAWLDGQPREVSVWIAARAAARRLPIWWDAALNKLGEYDRNVTTLLPVLRTVLISSVAVFRPTDDITSASAGTSYAVYPATAAAAADAAAASDDAAAAVRAATAAARAADARIAAAHAPIVWSAIRTDADHAAGGTLPDALPLWSDGQNPFEQQLSDIKARVADAPDAADWQFWLDWYDAQLAGRTLLPDPALTWDMLEQIALIDTATWEAGPEVVNPKIREIRELYRLRSEVAALQAEKEAFLAARASQAKRRHNQPPEGLVDDQPEVARQITIVWDSLDEARDALEQDTPDKSRLRGIADRLLSALNVIVRYCGKVADATVMAAAKVGGGAIGTALLDHVANNGRLMQFAKDLLTYASGG